MALISVAGFVIVIDYISLYKTRKVLDFAIRSTVNPIYAAVADLMLTLFLIIVVFCLIDAKMNDQFEVLKSAYNIVSSQIENAKALILHRQQDKSFPIDGLVFSTPYIMPLWILAFSASTLVLEFIRPLQNAVAWFFPVEEHPIRAIGIVAAGLILITSFAWALIRPLFA